MGKEISYLSHEKYTFTTYTGEKLIYKWGIFFKIIHLGICFM